MVYGTSHTHTHTHSHEHTHTFTRHARARVPSDARIVDQLIYKWSHSRKIIASVLLEKYALLIEAGYPLTRAEVVDDVARLFGGDYEAFRGTPGRRQS